MKLGKLAMSAGVFLGSSVFAAPFTYYAGLSGANENPPVMSPATGLATVIVDTAAHTLAVDVSFAGLIGPVTAAHIHCCVLPPSNVGVATQTPTFVVSRWASRPARIPICSIPR